MLSISSGWRIPGLFFTCLDLAPLSSFSCVCVVFVCVCFRAHLVVGLLVQRDRRVIKGVLDWLPVKDQGIARRGNSAVVAQTHRRSHRAHRVVLMASDIVFLIPSVRSTTTFTSRCSNESLLFPHWSPQMIASYKAIKK